MDIKLIIEVIGYIGSALVLVSFLMTSVVKLRMINLIGCVVFAGYALAIRSYPTAIMNICLAGINIFHLMRIFREERTYSLIKTEVSDGFVSYLLTGNAEDIHKWFPEFSLKDMNPDIAYLVCCESIPAGIFLGKQLEEGTLEVLLDYAAPAYRDTSVGSFIHAHMALEGYKFLVFRQEASGHVPYLTKMGYIKGEDDSYRLDLTRIS